jgi:hypothetical protein
MAASCESLVAIDGALERSVIPPLTRWWGPTLETFLSHPTARILAAEVGRGGAKSHTAVKLGVNEVIGDDHRKPRVRDHGQRGGGGVARAPVSCPV